MIHVLTQLSQWFREINFKVSQTGFPASKTLNSFSCSNFIVFTCSLLLKVYWIVPYFWCIEMFPAPVLNCFLHMQVYWNVSYSWCIELFLTPVVCWIVLHSCSECIELFPTHTAGVLTCSLFLVYWIVPYSWKFIKSFPLHAAGVFNYSPLL